MGAKLPRTAKYIKDAQSTELTVPWLESGVEDHCMSVQRSHGRDPSLGDQKAGNTQPGKAGDTERGGS